MGDFQSFHQVAMEACHHQVETTLKEAGKSDDTITSAMVHMSKGSPFTNLLLCTFWASGKDLCNSSCTL